jgi:hypothetical protein
MKAKLRSHTDSEGHDLGDYIHIWCPGCEGYHTPRVRHGNYPDGDITGLWTWNGNEDSPTINPSILVNASEPNMRCHSFVRDGKIQFLDDCFHHLKGQTVDLPNVDD